ncbi:MAG: hypothetical protein MUD17_14035 [Gemmatimonadaceae bacterium]|nr:hypothetical protein [Gemmatimonadaceae bacterium]
MIAEGVETAEQSERLHTLQCTEQQGHHFAPALPLAALSPTFGRVRGRSERPYNTTAAD